MSLVLSSQCKLYDSCIHMAQCYKTAKRIWLHSTKIIYCLPFSMTLMIAGEIKEEENWSRNMASNSEYQKKNYFSVKRIKIY